MDEKTNNVTKSELKSKGVALDNGVELTDQNSVDALSSRGYGTLEQNSLILSFYEALYLMDKKILEVSLINKDELSFQDLLRYYEKINDNAWVNYLVYRDLRSRGYVVRGGFGAGIDFRIYERGSYRKNVASTLILSTQEGRPLSIEYLTRVMKQCQSQKKALVLAVMNRRGEIVYYSVSKLTFAKQGKKQGNSDA
jgi:tRNA-intron endonuclease